MKKRNKNKRSKNLKNLEMTEPKRISKKNRNTLDYWSEWLAIAELRDFNQDHDETLFV